MATVMTTIPKRLPHSSYSGQWYFSNDFILSYFPRKFPALITDLGQNRLWRRMGCNGGKATTTDANFKYVVCFVSMSRTKCWVFYRCHNTKKNQPRLPTKNCPNERFIIETEINGGPDHWILDVVCLTCCCFSSTCLLPKSPPFTFSLHQSIRRHHFFLPFAPFNLSLLVFTCHNSLVKQNIEVPGDLLQRICHVSEVLGELLQNIWPTAGGHVGKRAEVDWKVNIVMFLAFKLVYMALIINHWWRSASRAATFDYRPIKLESCFLCFWSQRKGGMSTFRALGKTCQKKSMEVQGKKDVFGQKSPIHRFPAKYFTVLWRWIEKKESKLLLTNLYWFGPLLTTTVSWSHLTT